MANSLNVILSLDTKPFESAIKRVEGRLNAFAKGLSSAGSALTQSITLPLAGIGIAAGKSFADIEKLENALAAVMKLEPQSQALREEMEKLRKVAEAPGLGFEQAVRASARLQAVGLSANQARETIVQFGNAVARSGGGAAELDGAVLALTQIASKGKISAEEINQLNERIFEIRPALEAAFGTSNSEELQKLGISSEEFIAKVTQEFAKLERVNGGLANSFENFRDSAAQAFGELGREINRLFDLQGVIDSVSKALEGAANYFTQLDDSTKRTIVVIGGLVAAAGPLLLALGKLTSVFSLALAGARNFAAGLTFLATPLGAIVALVGVAAAAYISYATQLSVAERVQRTMNEVQSEAAKSIAKEKVQLDQLIGVATDEAKSKKERATALKDLQKLAPDYFKGLDTEKSKIEDIKEAGKGYLDFLLKRATYIAAQEKLIEVEKKLLDTQQLAADSAPKLWQTVINGLKGVGTLSGFASGQMQSFTDNLRDNLNVAKLQREELLKTLGTLKDFAPPESSGSSFNSDFERLDAAASVNAQVVEPQNVPVLKSENLAPLKTISEAQLAIEELNNFLAQQDSILESTRSKAASLGLTYEQLSSQVGLANTSIKDVVPGLGQVNTLLTRTQEAANNAKQAFADFGNNISNAVNQGLADVAAGIGETLGNLASGTGNLKGIGNVIANLMEQIGKAAIALGIQLAAIRLSIKSLNPVLAIVGGTLLIAASKLFRNRIEGAVPKLAEGGIVPPGFPNDTFPAFLSSDEAVIPLDKLGDIGSATRLTGTFLIRGEDLELSLERTKQEKERIK